MPINPEIDVMGRVRICRPPPCAVPVS
jgi:hypothetical protein